MTAIVPAGIDLTEQAATYDRSEGLRTVPGLTVAPGLVIIAAYRNDRTTIPRRYKINHASTGLNIPTGTHCATHVIEAANALTSSGIDWTQDKETLLADKARLTELVIPTRQLCDNLHYGCPGDPDPWHIRCNTCDWEYDPEDGDLGDVPTTAREARRIADGHDCEPWIEIKKPGTDTWQPPYAFANEPAGGAE